MRSVVTGVAATCLGLEALNNTFWAARIVSVAATYDWMVLGLVVLRIAVTATQFAGAAMLIGRALPAMVFARGAFLASAVLLVIEIGFGFAPTSIPPWLRTPVVLAYVVYAATCIALLTLADRGASD